jgi:selenocysteine-specific elongation factor
MQRYLLLGTAGHIDHGKTALVKALTGVDTDRLPEEKQRGITIDLGFAALELDGLLLGIVDVPGHERFIKNMLAGAMGIDLALLVVAADEGVMPQTREHFEALSYLRIAAGVIAITKCDLVDEGWIALVEEDVSKLVAGSFLQNSAIVQLSTKTGYGLKELRGKLAEAADKVPERSKEGPFRLSIDRCFSAPGHGTVVTGSVASGEISCGDKLLLLPEDISVQVRNIESHGQSLETIRRGQRAALNLTGVHFRDITRGDILTTPGSVVPSRLLSVCIEASRFQPRPLKTRTDIRLYTGATETVGRLRLLEARSLSPGESQIGQIELQEPVCTTWGQPFVARGLAANEVMGGGQIIDPRAYRVASSDTERIGRIRDLLDGDDERRAAAIAALAGARSWTLDELTQRAGVTNCAAVVDRLVETAVLRRFDLSGYSRWLHHEVVTQLEARLEASLNEEHHADPICAQVPLGRLRRHFVTLEPPELLVQLARRLSESGRLRLEGEYVASADWRPLLSLQQLELLGQILAMSEQAGLTPPSVGEMAAKFQKPVAEIESLLDVAVSRNELVRLPDKDSRDANAAQRARLYLHCSAERRLINRLAAQLSEPAEWTVSRFGEVFGLSRKYALPLCNHLDQIGITSRRGDLRKLHRSESLPT